MGPIESYWVEALAVVGAAQLIIQGLYGAVDKLEQLAAETEAEWDDEAVSRVAKVLEWSSSVLKLAAMILSPLAMRRPR